MSLIHSIICFYCKQIYNEIDRKPLKSNICSHSICSFCIEHQSNFDCRICLKKDALKDVIVNYQFIQVLPTIKDSVDHEKLLEKLEEVLKKETITKLDNGPCSECGSDSNKLRLCIQCAKNADLITKNLNDDWMLNHLETEDLELMIPRIKSISICADCAMDGIHKDHEGISPLDKLVNVWSRSMEITVLSAFAQIGQEKTLGSTEGMGTLSVMVTHFNSSLLYCEHKEKDEHLITLMQFLYKRIPSLTDAEKEEIERMKKVVEDYTKKIEIVKSIRWSFFKKLMELCLEYLERLEKSGKEKLENSRAFKNKMNQIMETVDKLHANLNEESDANFIRIVVESKEHLDELALGLSIVFFKDAQKELEKIDDPSSWELTPTKVWNDGKLIFRKLAANSAFNSAVFQYEEKVKKLRNDLDQSFDELLELNDLIHQKGVDGDTVQSEIDERRNVLAIKLLGLWKLAVEVKYTSRRILMSILMVSSCVPDIFNTIVEKNE